MGDGETASEQSARIAKEDRMKKPPLTIAQKRENRRTGAMGGRARARSLTKARRREIAIAASKVAAARRTAKAKR